MASIGSASVLIVWISYETDLPSENSDQLAGDLHGIVGSDSYSTLF